jgi:hypothetical protein
MNQLHRLVWRNRIGRIMNPGPLFKAIILSCAMSVLAMPQNRPAPTVPGEESQFPVSQTLVPQNHVPPNQAPQVPAQELSVLPAPTPLPQNANEYVRQAIEHEVAELDRDHTHWRYHLHREDEKNNVDRDVIETSQGSLARTLLLWGKPLTAEQRQKDEERMRKLVSDPEERAQRAKRDKEDDEKVRKMLRAISQAFTFTYVGEESGAVRLSFVPNPHYDPPSMELRIFRSLNGKLWIDRTQNRLARVEGALFEDVNFGWGILGRLYKGGTFMVEQRYIGEGHWEVVSEEVNMVGRAVLFKTISRKQKQALSDFRRMPDSITLSQAYDLLQKESGSVSANGEHVTLQPQGKN